MKTVLVTGGNGQLAKCIKDVIRKDGKTQFIFTDLDDLDITNQLEVQTYFDKNKIDYCINCAAYTAVDFAETNKENAREINVEGVNNLAIACKSQNTLFIQISTDFVFDGEKNEFYLEGDETNPLSVYGQTKLDGEKTLQNILKNHFIIRTSWLYSEYGNNFMKTMLKLGNEREELSIVNDQIGTPTYAKDLARVVLKIIETQSQAFGTYHYSNEGIVSWFDFAKEIFHQEKIKIKLNPIPTSAYPTPAKRPKYSVLDKDKIKETFNIEIPFWKKSLTHALDSYRK